MGDPPGGPAGMLVGVGLGPGDPELVTLKARRMIEAADVVAYPTSRRGPGVARVIVDSFLRDDHIEVPMIFPVTTEEPDHPRGYEGALADFYDRSAEELASHLDRGRMVVVLCEGDPFFYGSYMYLHDRLAHRYPTEVVPGVTAFSAAAARTGMPLAKRDDVLVVLPGTLPRDVISQRLRDADAAVIMKLGRRFEAVRGAAADADVSARAVYVERASTSSERVRMIDEVDGDVPYMSLVLVPTAREVGEEPDHAGAGGVTVVGLGPAGPRWLTPEARDALADATHLVGYGPYLDRVPVREGQQRHSSGNRDEVARGREALALAARGESVAVVSSGDPGIFAMAAAVFEAMDDAGRPPVDVRVVPGLSAMQAAAARVGAPLGHDFCVLSLSDRLKPWGVIERRLRAAAEGDMVVAIYNPASRSRRDQLESAREILLGYRAGETPVVIARDVGGDEERIVVSTLEGFDSAEVDMRTLVIVGSSRTRVLARAGADPLVYTPRSYPG